MSTVKSFTVHRPTWLRGGPETYPVAIRKFNSSSSLLNNTHRCSLGFLGAVCGYTDREIRNYISPAEVVEGQGGTDLWPKMLLQLIEKDDENTGIKQTLLLNSRLCNYIMDVNDDNQLSDAERERRLTDLFSQAGITVTFTDEPEPQKP